MKVVWKCATQLLEGDGHVGPLAIFSCAVLGTCRWSRKGWWGHWQDILATKSSQQHQPPLSTFSLSELGPALLQGDQRQASTFVIGYLVPSRQCL